MSYRVFDREPHGFFKNFWALLFRSPISMQYMTEASEFFADIGMLPIFFHSTRIPTKGLQKR